MNVDAPDAPQVTLTNGLGCAAGQGHCVTCAGAFRPSNSALAPSVHIGGKPFMCTHQRVQLLVRTADRDGSTDCRPTQEAGIQADNCRDLLCRPQIPFSLRSGALFRSLLADMQSFEGCRNDRLGFPFSGNVHHEAV